MPTYNYLSVVASDDFTTREVDVDNRDSAIVGAHVKHDMGTTEIDALTTKTLPTLTTADIATLSTAQLAALNTVLANVNTITTCLKALG